MPDIEERVSTLEGVLMKLAYLQVNSQINMDEIQTSIKELSKQSKQTHQNMEEMDKKTRQSIEELIKHGKQTQASIDKSIQEMKDDTEKSRKDFNYRWGKMAEKMGTIVEDMVAPNIKSIAEKYFALKDCEDFMTNREKRHPRDKGREKEFDVIAVYGDKIILNETKVTPRMKYVEEFVEFIKNDIFYEFFPEYKGKKLIPIFASIKIPDNIIKHLSRNNILAMAMSKSTMDIVNPEIIKYLTEV